jgi:hypothetical protein
MRVLGLGLGRFTSSLLGLRSLAVSLGILRLASRLESTVKPPAFNIGVDLQLLCRNVMEARMT